MTERLPPMDEIKVGDKLRFVRDFYDGNLLYSKRRTVYVIQLDEHVAIIAMARPVRDIHAYSRRDKCFSIDGFKYCRFIDPEDLKENCKRVE